MNKLVALAGNPNVGKSTIFNELTGMTQHTGNWIGKTVEIKKSTFYYKYNDYDLVDLPGTYSLNPISQEENISSNFLKTNSIDCVVCVVDATALERSLLLVYQIMEYTDNIIVLLNLCDQAHKKGINIDAEQLSVLLEVPVVKATALSGRGINQLLEVLNNIVNSKIKITPNKVKYQKFDDVQMQSNARAGAMNLESMNVASKVIKYNSKNRDNLNKLDKLLLGKFTSIISTIIIFGIVLWITIYFSNVPSQALRICFDNFESWLGNFLLSLNVNTNIVDILVHGVLKITFWVVAVMLPPMAIFFPMFALMEDFGILPRFAFNLDPMFEKSGACGKQAITTCMGFGCNAVGVTSARIIDSPKQRLIAIITNSLTPCNGRFPFLIAIISIFMGSNSIKATVILLCLLILSYLMTLLCNKILNLTVLKENKTPLIMELPSYRKPSFIKTLKFTIKDKILLVLLRAIIVAAPMGLVIWLLANIKINSMNLLYIFSNCLNPVANLIGLDGTILFAFILGFPANEIVMPIALMIYLNNSVMADYSSLTELKQILIDNSWTIKTALCAMVFSMFHFPCSTTVLTIYRETKSFKWTLLSLVVPLILGFCACFIINIVL